MSFSAGYLMSMLLISFLGMGCFLYGKKMQRFWPMIGGAVLCAYPYFVSNVGLMWVLAAAVCAVLYGLREKE